ncbi:type IV secretion system protein VirB10 [Campylobacter sp. MIT 12-8780]|nr:MULTISPECIES: type IV secretion system protein VirB10 [unclassified Campylobacter]NDJ28066.1 TrbI/VirB10 family protein [Campylobacter sp. MIT 19-121]TQR39968.1 type IV secretion system protein VirB10 [Campylobacter sp. MIT 12-8780]
MSENQQNSQNENVLLELSSKNNKKLISYALFALGALLFFLIILWTLSSLGKAEEQQNTQKENTNINLSDSVKNNRDFILTNDSQEKNLLDLAQTPQTLPSQANTTTLEPMLAEKSLPKPRIIKGIGTAVIASSSDSGQSGSPYASDSANNGANFASKPQTLLEFGQNGATGSNNQISSNTNSNTGEVFTPTAASFSQFNPSLLLPKGTYIGCALQTRLISEIKGGISCVVSNDIYSSNGHTLLIEKGSVITGAYSGGELNDGSTRLFVIWQEIRTPYNIVIPVFSGATDPLGAAGVEGYVNHHYMKRFGAAVLLSVIDDSLAILASELSKKSGNNTTNYYNFTENTREQASEIANTALEKMIDIKPTLYKNQGDLVGVYVNKDIDFSKVYKLRRKR